MLKNTNSTKKFKPMKKIILSVVLLVAGVMTGVSQQLPLYSQYLLNNFLLNPAIAGTNNYIPIRLTGRMQYLGFDGAPRTYAVSAHSPIMRDKMGVGGFIFRDQIGAVSQTGIQLAYSYHMPINNDINLSLGLGFRAFQYVLDESKLDYIDEDPYITGAVQSTFVPDADFGVYVYSKDWFAGLSAAQLIQYKVKLGDVDVESQSTTKRHYFITGGYTFEAGQDFQVEPSILVKATESTPVNIDLNVRAIYQKNYWLGLSYRTDKSLITMLSVKYQIYFLGFAYDYSFSDIKSYSSGSFEIVLGVNLGEGANKGSKLL